MAARLASHPPAGSPRIVVVGGGIAALEYVLAIRALAGEAAELTLVAPEVFFTLRPWAVARPFAPGRLGRLPLDRFMSENGGRAHYATAVRIDAPARVVVCSDGRRLSYDELVLAPGARRRAPYVHGLTFGMTGDRDALEGFLADLEQGHGDALAFVVPTGCTWPLPLYELALMTAERLRRTGRPPPALHLVTPERAPLDLFGPEASAAVVDLLKAAAVSLHTDTAATIEQPGVVGLAAGQELAVTHVVALPRLSGPRLSGLPHDPRGFLEVTRYGRLAAHPRIHAIGDAVSGTVKQGGLAAGQADEAAADIAGSLGFDVAEDHEPGALHARLLTGRGAVILEEGRPVWCPDANRPAPAWAATKVAARHLSRYLERSDLIELPVSGAVG